MGLLRVAISLLLLVALTQVDGHATTIQVGTASEGALATGVTMSGYGLQNWTSGFIAVWSMDEGTSSVRQSNSLASCGADCDLTPVAVDQDTSDKIEGAASAQLTSPSASQNASSLQCDANNDASDGVDDCTDLNISSSNATWGGWFQANGSSGTVTGAQGTTANFAQLMGAHDSSDDEGYGLFAIDYLGILFLACTADDVTSSVNVQASALGQDTTDTGGFMTSMRFIACVYDASADTITGKYLYTDYSESASSADSLTSSSQNFMIGTEETDKSQALNYDNLFVADKALTNADLCRICSCGIDGRNCSCSIADTTNYASAGLNASYCGSCTLPDCNSAIAGS